MRIARVFPSKNNMSPTDIDCYFDRPGLPFYHYDEIHVSCTFTWDIPRALELVEDWEGVAPMKIGGPAFSSPCEDFIPGRYIAPGIIFTSRGCPNRCEFCHVPKREGPFRELPIVPGHIIQDNNILAASDKHWDQLCAMLKKQRAIEFKGGLEARRLTAKRIEDLKGLKIASLWLACDTPGALPVVMEKIKMLHQAGFSRNKIYVYVICGKDEDEETARMEQIYLPGGYPFAQLFQPEERIEYSQEWKDFAQFWSRPAAIYGGMKSLFL